MRAILVISTVLVLANARPDVSHGYQYDTPQDNYQGAVPDQSVNYGTSGETLPNFVPVQTVPDPALPPVYPDTQQPDNFVPTGPSDVQLQGVPQFSQTAPEQQNDVSSQILTTGSEAYKSADAPQQLSLSTSYDPSPSGVPQQQFQSSFASNSQQQSSFGSSAQQQASFSGNAQQQTSFSGNAQQVSSSFSQASQSDEELPPIITKHFYVHAAPEEPEESQGPRFVNVGRKQKNYKIIFIKAPTYGFNSQVIPIVQPNEEKTIVYVLSKKPSYNTDISLPPVPVTEPSKPEVFFIKYKTDNEAQEAQQKIQGAYEKENLGGSNDNFINNFGGSIGNAFNSFQNTASAALNTVVGQAQGLASGFANNLGAIVGSQPCSSGSGCAAGSAPTATAQTQSVQSDEEQHSLGGASESANLVETQQEAHQAQQVQQVQQQDEKINYLPPNQR